MTTESTAPSKTLPAGSMNDGEPIKFPLALPSTLGADALYIYKHSQGQKKLDRDIFDPSSARFKTGEERDAFVPTERMLTAIAELERAHLATYNLRWRTLRVHKVHEHYTFAQGRGSQLIRVSVFDEYQDEAQLLAVLVGGDLESRTSDRGRSEIAVRARHEDATDVEHDASSTALLLVRNASEPVFTGYGTMSFTGVLTSAQLYPLGVDPLAADGDETRPGEICTQCETPHPFAPYQPPTVAGLGGLHFVTIETRPFRPYLVAAP
ncbi:hypothetical protein [Cryobacterium zhongshanensis]|uniref:Uncharacterized protein n=1 Tax=Cryobacterium zhongshanensis TaxID=2928153 RepID=A0AA41R060_9MICO|nr:hypothetical protein [Cryobacterium zhongshanensis]MCI4659608.1 hypothetical protein [Cryobacterium zhongshanensis]